MRRTILLAAALGGLSACMPSDADVFTDTIDPIETEVQVTRGFGPPDANPDACYAREITPAVIETVTDQRVMEPAQYAPDGSEIAPAIYITETRQSIVEERRELWFETPCEADSDPAFITSLQRALRARGLYSGPVNGEMNTRTRNAIRAYQEPQGLNSPVLSLAAARQMGLSIWDPELAAPETPTEAEPAETPPAQP